MVNRNCKACSSSSRLPGHCAQRRSAFSGLMTLLRISNDHAGLIRQEPWYKNGGSYKGIEYSALHGSQRCALIEEYTNVHTVDATKDLQRTQDNSHRVDPNVHADRPSYRSQHDGIMYNNNTTLSFDARPPSTTQPQGCKLLLARPAL